MSLKRAPDETVVAPQRPFRLARLDGGDDQTTTLSLDDINDNCILEIFKCLSVEDLNSIVVFISSRCRDLRNHDSLDQTRTGTIICTEKTTLESIHTAFVSQGWSQVFTGNGTRLKVVGLERMRRFPNEPTLPFEYLLPCVSSLDMSFDPSADNRIVAHKNNVLAFAWMLPNLNEVDLSYMTIDGCHTGSILSCMDDECRMLKKLVWNGSRDAIALGCIVVRARYKRRERHLFNELVLDNSLFSSFESSFSSSQEYYIFYWCTQLERLSIKNVTLDKCDEEDEHAQPVPQEQLVHMVRHHPTLRWLRSDLSEENIAMLQQERPDITFVSE